MAKVLIIDDDQGIRKLFYRFLRRRDHLVCCASDGEAATKVCEVFDPEVVITDIVMPRKEGLETIKFLRQKYRDVKIIAISGGGRDIPLDYLKYAAMLGADKTFSKPLNLPLLEEAIQELLQTEMA